MFSSPNKSIKKYDPNHKVLTENTRKYIEVLKYL